MKCIGIIGAMEQEVAKIKEKMQDVTITSRARMDFYEGTLEGKKVVVVRSGIGKVNAGMCTQILADVFGVEAVINTGIAGSLNNDVNIGDIVLSTDVLHHDMDAIGFGYKKGQIPQMDEFSFPADEKLRKLAAKVCKEVNPEISVFEGRICSGDQFISDKSVKDAIISEFGGFAVEIRIKSIQKIGLSWYFEGCVLKLQNKNKEAYRCFIEARKSFQEISDKGDEISVLKQMAEIEKRFYSADEAMKRYNEVVNIARQIPDTLMWIDALKGQSGVLKEDTFSLRVFLKYE